MYAVIAGARFAVLGPVRFFDTKVGQSIDARNGAQIDVPAVTILAGPCVG